MAGYRHQYVTPGDIRFHYLEWGDPAAPPVVLLHGTSGNAHSWDLLSPVLAQQYHVLAFDCRDHGESGDSPVPLNGDLLVSDVKETVDYLGLETFGLIGLSMGGRTAMNFTGTYPDRVNQLVIEDVGPEIPAETSARVSARNQSFPANFDSLDDLIAWNRQSRIHASDAWMRYAAELSSRPLPDGRREIKYRPKKMPPGQTTMTSVIDTWGIIRNISCPTLIVRGADSEILNEDISNRMLERIPGSHAIVVERAGHAVHEDNPEDYNNAVASFFGVS